MTLHQENRASDQGGPCLNDPATTGSTTAAINPPDVTEATIETLVRTFYDEVRHDTLLGPIFAAAIDDWEPHLQRMMAFWSSVMLTSGRYKGRPMEKHMAIPGLQPAHFERWLAMFRDAAGKVCDPAAAAAFVRRAEQIAQSLQIGIFGVGGRFAAPGQPAGRP